MNREKGIGEAIQQEERRTAEFLCYFDSSEQRVCLGCVLYSSCIIIEIFIVTLLFETTKIHFIQTKLWYKTLQIYTIIVD